MRKLLAIISIIALLHCSCVAIATDIMVYKDLMISFVMRNDTCVILKGESFDDINPVKTACRVDTLSEGKDGSLTLSLMSFVCPAIVVANNSEAFYTKCEEGCDSVTVEFRVPNAADEFFLLQEGNQKVYAVKSGSVKFKMPNMDTLYRHVNDIYLTLYPALDWEKSFLGTSAGIVNYLHHMFDQSRYFIHRDHSLTITNKSITPELITSYFLIRDLIFIKNDTLLWRGQPLAKINSGTEKYEKYLDTLNWPVRYYSDDGKFLQTDNPYKKSFMD